MRIQADDIEFGIEMMFVVAHDSEAVRAVKTRMNTLIVVLSESVIWYDYGMNPKSNKAQARDVEAERDSSSTGGTRGTQGMRRGEEEKAGFWLVKRKEWKTAYNPEGESVGINIGVVGGSADSGDERFGTSRPRSVICRRGIVLVGHPRPTAGSYPARPAVPDIGYRNGELEYSLGVRLSSSCRLSVAHHQRAFPHVVLVGMLVGWQVPRLVFGKRVDLPGLERRYGVARERTAERGRQGRDLGCRPGLSSGQRGEEVG
jgi:hypothetical protein